jgi:hypothetical protein
MILTAQGIDYEKELTEIRNIYVCMTPQGRLRIINERLRDPDSGPNRLVTVVSAVEALARTLAMHASFTSKFDISTNYSKYRNSKPADLICKYLLSKGITDPETFFKEDNWLLFDYAVQSRNLVTHECTYLGQDKYPYLIQVCEEILEALTKLAGIGKSVA